MKNNKKKISDFTVEEIKNILEELMEVKGERRNLIVKKVQSKEITKKEGIKRQTNIELAILMMNIVLSERYNLKQQNLFEE